MNSPELIPCAAGDCDRPANRRGWCYTHYSRWKRTGTTDKRTHPPLAVRLAKFVRRGADDECWPFMGGRSNGYGMIKSNGVHQRAHRVAWEIENGPIPDGLLVCHRCDNRPCCNTNHLFLGTHQDNFDDMVAKGRGHIGEKNGRARLTAASVRHIRTRLGLGFSQSGLAREYGVAPGTIHAIASGRNWAGVE